MSAPATERPKPSSRSIGLVAADTPPTLTSLVRRLGYQPVDAHDETQDLVASIVGAESDAGALQACRAVSDRAPVILLSDSADFEFRLGARRAGATAVMSDPPDPIELLEWLQQFDAAAHPPTRVLIVDDDPFVSEAYACSLQLAGFVAVAETDPSLVLEAIDAVRPDLILLDMNLPGMNGLEVAAIIRQDRSALALPIVFLSGERSQERRLAARRVGGDDFIDKRTAPADLIDIVRMRADRARALKELAERDGLTGLLNHGAFKSRLRDALAIGTRFSLCLIDIDHFKAINDTHGHPAGDEVLRGLARTLRGGLRSNDIVARYGGEEFGVLLMHAEPDCAAGALDRLRSRFAEQTHGVHGITATFSAGVVPREVIDDPAPEALLAAADAALYAAKRAGRNRLERVLPELPTD